MSETILHNYFRSQVAILHSITSTIPRIIYLFVGFPPPKVNLKRHVG